MDEYVLPDPVGRYKKALVASSLATSQLGTFDQGLIAAGLVLIGRIRLIRALEGASLIAMSREEIAGALETTLNALGVREQAESVYEQLVKIECSPPIQVE